MRKNKFLSILLILAMLTMWAPTAFGMDLIFETDNASVNGQTLLVTVEKATGEPVYIGKAQVNNGQVSIGGIPDDLVASTLVLQASTPNGVSIPFSVSYNNSDITPTSASFAKASPADVTVTMTLKGNTLTGLKNGSANLTLNTDYTVSGSTVVIKKSYLSGLSAGQATITFDFSGGVDRALPITITDPPADPGAGSDPGTSTGIGTQIGTGTGTDTTGLTVETPEVQTQLDQVTEQLSQLQNPTAPQSTEAVAAAAGTIVGNISDAAGRVTTSAAATQLLQNVTSVLGSLGQAATTASTNDAKASLAESAGAALDTGSKLIDKVVIVDEAIALAKELINSTSGVVMTGKIVEEKALAVAQSVVQKAGTVQVDSKDIVVTGTTAKAIVDSQQLIANVNKVAQTATEMKSSLQQNGIIQKKDITKVATIKVTSAAGVAKVDVELSAAVFTAAKNQNLNKIAIETGVANISVAPDAIPGSASQAVTLTAAVVAKAELSPAVSQTVGDAPVYDFNAVVGSQTVSKFDKQIDISVPYTLKPGENSKKVTVYYINDNGQLENVIGKYDEKTDAVKFTTNHFSKFFAKSNDKQFADLTKFSWAEEQIEVLASKGIISGRTDLNFDPAADITRAEFASLLAKMLKLSGDVQALPFDDVAQNAWYAEGVAAAYANGIVQGRSPIKFDPNGKITRQEMAAMINKVLVSQGYFVAQDSELSIFKDAGSIPAWAKPGVAMAVREGIVRGMNDGGFQPEAYANRAQAAVMLYQLFNK